MSIRKHLGYLPLLLALVVVLTMAHSSVSADDDLIPQPVDMQQDLPKPELEDGRVVTGPMRYTTDDNRATLNSTEAAASPVINVWYGANQTFGDTGTPQKWVNVLGNVSGPNPITDLTYSLNGGTAISIPMGPDGRRLAEEGDFAIELNYLDLNIGNNTVDIEATDITGTTFTSVTVNYDPTTSWSSPIVVDWGSGADLQELAQVVDGQWAIDGDNVKALTYDFDRLLAIGDMSWSHYEVTVPINVHAIDEGGYGGNSNGPGIGLITRWYGHYDVGIDPFTGWQRLGALGWYRWSEKQGVRSEGWQMVGYGGKRLTENSDTMLELDTEYMLKLRVEDVGRPTANYKFKAWKTSDPEPAEWMMESLGVQGEPRSGSIVLLAHHVDATFGEVTVDLIDTASPPNLVVNKTGMGSVSASPATGPYQFGQDVVVEATPAEGHVFAGWAGSVSGTENPLVFELFDDKIITAVFTDPSQPSPQSDDFSGCELNTNVWTFVDPVGDGSYAVEDQLLKLSVPTRSEHNAWSAGNFTTRVMQPAENDDFEIETKMVSPISERSQLQGFIVEESDGNYIRFDIYHDGTQMYLFSASFINDSPTEQVKVAIDDLTDAFYLRVTRVGNEWTMSYSYNGNSWTDATPFTYVLDVNSVGLFAGTGGKTSPAHTAEFDYFFNNAAPIDPEDGHGNELDITTVGQGTVTASPDKVEYTCGETVEITAEAADGWAFESWSGDVVSTEATIEVEMTSYTELTATFVPQQVTLDVVVQSNGSGEGGSVTVSPEQETYDAGTEVTLTAEANPGWSFVGWSGDATGDTNPLVVTLDESTSITAIFEQETYTLTIDTVGQGSVSASPDQATYVYGDMVELSAEAADGWYFAGWSGDASGANPSRTITITGDIAVTATFQEGEPVFGLFLPMVVSQ